MIDTFARLRTVLLLMTVCTTVSAQICGNIPSSAPDSRFTDNGNGTVSDGDTGLMWKQCAEGQSGAGCTDGIASPASWQGALVAAANADFNGLMDWRLPNTNELESLVEWRCSGPAINENYFPNTPYSPLGRFWSASPDALSSDAAWYVNFGIGNVYTQPKEDGDDGYVRLVRGGW